MLRVFLILGCICSIFTSWGQAIDITNDTLLINGYSLSGKSSLQAYSKALDSEPDRVSEYANHIHTYESMGVFLYQDPDANVILAFTICYRGGSYEYSAKQPFTGRFTINGHLISSDLNKEMLKQIPNVQLSGSKVVAGEFDIYFDFEDSTGLVTSMEISTVFVD